MTKKEIVKVISDSTGVPQLKTKEIVQQTFDAIIDTLISEKRIELRKFGVFEVKRRKARNPRTGAQVDVEPKNVVTFQPGKEMEERVRQMALVEEKPRQARKTRMAAAASTTTAGHDGAAVATSAASENAAIPSGAAVGSPVNGDSEHKKRRMKKEV